MGINSKRKKYKQNKMQINKDHVFCTNGDVQIKEINQWRPLL